MKDKNILIYGYKKSGKDVLKLLYKDNNTTVVDKSFSDEDKKYLDSINVKYYLEDEIVLENYDLIVRSPGIVPINNKIIKYAYDNNILVTNEIEIAYKYLKNPKIIAITGSNGKTTTTTIIYNILKRCINNVHLAGNIGYPLSSLCDKVNEGDYIVLEISDHQLYDVHDFKADYAILTNLCETHLDFHGNYENYKLVKKKVFNNASVAIINEKNIDSVNLTSDLNCKKLYFNGKDSYLENDIIYLNGEEVLNINDIKIRGNHNYENIECALLLLNEIVFDKDNIIKELKEFKGVEHRIEYVDEINGVKYYNDSKSTNPVSTITALKTFNENIHLILGGFERGQDFSELNNFMDNVSYIYAVGEVSNRICSWAVSINKKVINAGNLENAMNKIKENVKSGDVVLLSPASASWDQYDKFEDRGDEFKKLTCKLKG